tara:strand:+ start:980 stop:1678 length:699 start_codon:yes stop_codon:yes gene_type:complete
MSVAIIFIGTNKYLNFFPKYYETCEELLFPGVKKQYYVFTDGGIFGDEIPDHITAIKIPHKEWPSITLERFHTILLAEELIQEHDWLLFLDADMRVDAIVNSEEVLNDEKDFIAVHHPCHYNTGTGDFERRPESEACITGNPLQYYQGCLWGGKMEAVIPMMKLLKERVDKDYSNDIIAVWHDESHLNRFFIENQDRVHALPPDYAYPECFPQYPYQRKIVHLAKDNSSYQV